MDAELRGLLPLLLSGEAAVRLPAERRVLELQRCAGFCASALRIAESEPRTSMMAATLLLRCVRVRWDAASGPIGPDEKSALRACVPGVVARSRGSAGWRQLREVAAEMGRRDFPDRWPAFVSNLVATASSGDVSSFVGALAVIRSFCRYFVEDDGEEQEDVARARAAAQEQLQVPLLRMTQWMCAQIPPASPSPLLLQALRMSCRIFYSLSTRALSAFVGDNLAEWMGMFQRLLRVPGEDAEAMRLRAATLEIACLYVERYDYEFSPYWPAFAEEARAALARSDAGPGSDRIARAALRFFAASVTKTALNSAFGTEDAVRALVFSIVLPNVYIRAEDAAMFESDSEAFVRCEMGDPGAETRRSAALELLKAVVKTFPYLAGPVLTEAVQHVLQRAKTDGSAHKEAVVSLFAAWGDRCARFFNAQRFFEDEVVHEMGGCGPRPDEEPLLVAACLRFAWTFIYSLKPSSIAVSVEHTTSIANFTKKQSLRSMACIFLERAMCVAPAAPESAARTMSAMLRVARESGNDRAMACVARAISLLGERSAAFAGDVVAELAPMLARLSADGTERSAFGHFLFEALAALVSSVCAADARKAASFEAALLPLFQAMLRESAKELVCYALQMIALLIGVRPDGAVPVAYEPFIAACVSGELTGDRVVARDVCRVLCQYVRKGGSPGSVGEVMVATQSFLRPPGALSLALSAFRCVQCAFLFADESILDAHVHDMIGAMLQRYDALPKTWLARYVVVSLSVLTIRRGPQYTLRALGGGAARLLRDLWAPTMHHDAVGACYQRMVLGTTLLVVHPPLRADTVTWAALVGGLAALCLRHASSLEKLVNHMRFPPALDAALETGVLQMAVCPPLDAAPVVERPEALFLRSLSASDRAAVRTHCDPATIAAVEELERLARV